MYGIRAKITGSSAGIWILLLKFAYFLCWRFAVVERLLQASKVFPVVEPKVDIGSAKLYSSRKIVVRLSGICISCGVDHHGLSLSSLYWSYYLT